MLKEIYGIDVPIEMQSVIADEVKRVSEERDGEISPDEVRGIYKGVMKKISLVP